MKQLATILATLLLASSVCGQAKDKPAVAKHDAPPPIHSAKGVTSSPFDADHLKFARGLTRTPAHKLVSARRFDKTAIALPAQVLMLPKQLSMWGNDQYGDCVSASEAARKAAYSVFCGLPETFIPEANVIAWAKKYGYLNGADLPEVMTQMQTHGMTASDGKVYLDGPAASVNFADEGALQAALTTGPLNVGIDANALPSAAGNKPGWFSFGGTPGAFNNEDHCVAIFGYGPTATLFQQISTVYGGTATPPANAPANGYLLYTWSTVGVVDHAWIMSTMGEAWCQNPTTIGQTPTPTPVPPTPVPPMPVPPTPTPGVINITLDKDTPKGTYELHKAGTKAMIDQLQADSDTLKALRKLLESQPPAKKMSKQYPGLTEDDVASLREMLREAFAESDKKIEARFEATRRRLEAQFASVP